MLSPFVIWANNGIKGSTQITVTTSRTSHTWSVQVGPIASINFPSFFPASLFILLFPYSNWRVRALSAHVSFIYRGISTNPYNTYILLYGTLKKGECTHMPSQCFVQQLAVQSPSPVSLSHSLLPLLSLPTAFPVSPCVDLRRSMQQQSSVYNVWFTVVR
jgi:hypothetical protein